MHDCQPEESVLIVTDIICESIGRNLFETSLGLGFETAIIMMKPRAVEVVKSRRCL